MNGVMVSGFDSPVSTDVDASFCHPKALYFNYVAVLDQFTLQIFKRVTSKKDGTKKPFPRLIKEVERKRQLGEWLLQQERWDCFMLLFGESDTVSHHFWMFHDPQSPRFRNVPALRNAVVDVYQRLDQALGSLIEKSQSGLDLCVQRSWFWWCW